MSAASKTVVSGEASESDDEEMNTDQAQPQTGGVSQATEVGRSSGSVIVSGEASESDEEVQGEVAATDEPGKIPPLNVNPSEAGDHNEMGSSEPQSPTSPHSVEPKPKYNSLLNRKLRERNIALRRHLVDTVHQVYVSAGKELHNISTQLQRSQVVAQDVSHSMRNSTNDFLRIEDTLNIFSNCSILPNITFPEKSSQELQTSS